MLYVIWLSSGCSMVCILPSSPQQKWLVWSMCVFVCVPFDACDSCVSVECVFGHFYFLPFWRWRQHVLNCVMQSPLPPTPPTTACTGVYCADLSFVQRASPQMPGQHHRHRRCRRSRRQCHSRIPNFTLRKHARIHCAYAPNKKMRVASHICVHLKRPPNTINKQQQHAAAKRHS